MSAARQITETEPTAPGLAKPTLTAQHFINAGVVFVPGSPTPVTGPRDAQLMAALRGEIARRLEAVKNHEPSVAKYGECEACGDEMPGHRAGWCAVCIAVRVRETR